MERRQAGILPHHPSGRGLLRSGEQAALHRPMAIYSTDDLLLRKSDGILLVYDEDAAEGSPVL